MLSDWTILDYALMGVKQTIEFKEKEKADLVLKAILGGRDYKEIESNCDAILNILYDHEDEILCLMAE